MDYSSPVRIALHVDVGVLCCHWGPWWHSGPIGCCWPCLNSWSCCSGTDRVTTGPHANHVLNYVWAKCRSMRAMLNWPPHWPGDNSLPEDGELTLPLAFPVIADPNDPQSERAGRAPHRRTGPRTRESWPYPPPQMWECWLHPSPKRVLPLTRTE